MFDLLVMVVGSYAVDPGSIPANLQLRQKSVVGLEIANLQIWEFFKTWKTFNPILKFTYLTASSSQFGVLAKAMQWAADGSADLRATAQIPGMSSSHPFSWLPR